MAPQSTITKHPEFEFISRKAWEKKIGGEVTLHSPSEFYSNYIGNFNFSDLVTILRISLHQLQLYAVGDKTYIETFLSIIRQEFKGREYSPKSCYSSNNFYTKLWRGVSDLGVLDVRYDPSDSRTIQIVLNSPSLPLLSFLSDELNASHAKHNLSKVEVPLDFHTYHPDEIKYLLETSLWLKGARSVGEYRLPYQENYTTYVNNKRKQIKGVTIYLKNTSIKDREKVRLEYQLNRPKLSSCGITTIEELLNYPLAELLSDICFYDIDWRLYERFCLAGLRSSGKNNIEFEERLRMYLPQSDFLSYGVQHLSMQKRRIAWCNDTGKPCSKGSCGQWSNGNCPSLTIKKGKNKNLIHQRFLKLNQINEFIKVRIGRQRVGDILR